jgi:hypothetical protein
MLAPATQLATGGDLRKWITATYWGASGRRFKSCQPDQCQPDQCQPDTGHQMVFSFVTAESDRELTQRHTQTGSRRLGL